MMWLVVMAGAVGAGWLLGTGDEQVNAGVVLAWLPRGILILLQGATCGLCVRDRVRLGRAHASPTVAWLAKRWLAGSIAALLAFALSPVAWPGSCVPMFAGSAAVGLAVWMGNLPTKL